MKGSEKVKGQTNRRERIKDDMMRLFQMVIDANAMRRFEY